MKRSVVLGLTGVFLFGAFALPGKVCPTAHARPTASPRTPPCHRATSEAANPCQKMVCCLVPPADRFATVIPSVPMPSIAWAGWMPAPVPVSAASFDPGVSRRVHPPPGSSAGFLLAFSLRAPPALA